MAKKTQARSWIITISSLEKHELDQEEIIKLISLFMPTYCRISTEISSNGIRHTHIYIYAP